MNRIILGVVGIMMILGINAARDHVRLEAKVVEVIYFECKIDGMVLDVEFISPNGSLYGSCPAPVPPEVTGKVCIDCGYNITQYLGRNTTVLILNKSDEWLGEWTCKHGSASSNGTVIVTFPPETTTVVNDNDSCVVWICSLIICSVLLFVSVLWNCKPIWRWITSIKDFVLRRRRPRTNSDSETAPLLPKPFQCIKCKKCQQTGCSFCYECNAVLCGVCFNAHNDKHAGHNAFIFVPPVNCAGNFEVVCSSCENRRSELFCILHKCVTCISCKCVVHESLSMECTRVEIIRQKCQFSESITSKDIKYKRQIEVRHPGEKKRRRICGLCALSGNVLVISDTHYQELVIYMGFAFEKIIKISEEPSSIVHLFGTRFAISLSQCKEIIIYELNDLDLTEKNKIDLKDHGKPFSLAYNNDHFAVEIGEEDNGLIGIFDSDGHRLCHFENNNFAYFTGHSIRMALDYNKREVYVSALSMKKMSCLDFSGKEKWSVEMPSPRGVLFLPDFSLGNGIILLASKNHNAIYKVNPNDGKREIFLSENTLNSPRHMTYDKEEKMLYIYADIGTILIYEYPST